MSRRAGGGDVESLANLAPAAPRVGRVPREAALSRACGERPLGFQGALARLRSSRRPAYTVAR
jgi:hypothetical protein